MAHAVPAEYLDAIALPHEVRTRVVTLDADLVEVDELTGADGYLFGGSVTMTRLANPSRTLSGLTVANPGGIWTPRALADRFALFRRVKVQRGIVLPSGLAVMHTLLVGVIEAPGQQLDWTDDVLTLTCSDLWRTLAKRRLRQAASFEPGSQVGAALRALAVLAGWPDDDARFAIDDGGATLAQVLAVPQWALVPEAIEGIAADWSLWVRVSAEGVLTASPSLAPGALPAPVASFAPGESSTLLAVTKSLGDDSLYNATVVEGASAGISTIVATARDLNPDSATYNPPPGYDPAWPDGGPVGDLVREPYASAQIATYEQAQTKADSLLLESALIEERHDLSAFADARLEPGDAITLTVVEADVAGDQLIDSLTMSLSTGEGEDDMQASTKQLRSLVAA